MTDARFDVEELRKLVGDFGRNVVAPRVAAYDLDEHLPEDILHQMSVLGFFGGTVAEKWGGAGLDNRTFSVLIQEISKHDHILGVLMSMPSALVGRGIEVYGTDDQRETYLAPLARGEIFGGAGVTEPQSGSDVAGMQTHYRRETDRFIINGAKTWISNLDIANFFVTFARLEGSQRHDGISAFIVPRSAPGVSVQPFKNKLGFRPICTGDLYLDNVELGPEHLLGDERKGFAVAMTAVERGRLAVASRAVGMAQACLDDSIAYARERIVFGRPIAEFQMTKKKIADMAVEIEAARLLVENCAAQMDAGKRARKESSMAKLYASDVAQRVACEGVQIHGATGVAGEVRVSRMYRDAKVFQLVEGSNEVHRLLISEYVLGYRKEST